MFTQASVEKHRLKKPNTTTTPDTIDPERAARRARRVYLAKVWLRAATVVISLSGFICFVAAIALNQEWNFVALNINYWTPGQDANKIALILATDYFPLCPVSPPSDSPLPALPWIFHRDTSLIANNPLVHIFFHLSRHSFLFPQPPRPQTTNNQTRTSNLHLNRRPLRLHPPIHRDTPRLRYPDVYVLLLRLLRQSLYRGSLRCATVHRQRLENSRHKSSSCRTVGANHPPLSLPPHDDNLTDTYLAPSTSASQSSLHSLSAPGFTTAVSPAKNANATNHLQIPIETAPHPRLS